MIGLEIRGAVFDEPNRPFGGISVVLVGDFDQKLPVPKTDSLAQVLVNSVTDDKRMSVKEVLQLHAADVFGRFTKYTTFTTTPKVCSRVYTFHDRKCCGNRV